MVSFENRQILQVIHNSHLFFEAQRSGKLPANKRIFWRSSAHTRDGSECGKDLSGGYYQCEFCFVNCYRPVKG